MYGVSNLKQHTMSLEAYKKKKKRMLTKDFRIKLTKEEQEHLMELKNEIQVDQFFLSKVMNA